MAGISSLVDAVMCLSECAFGPHWTRWLNWQSPKCAVQFLTTTGTWLLKQGLHGLHAHITSLVSIVQFQLVQSWLIHELKGIPGKSFQCYSLDKHTSFLISCCTVVPLVHRSFRDKKNWRINHNSTVVLAGFWWHHSLQNIFPLGAIVHFCTVRVSDWFLSKVTGPYMPGFTLYYIQKKTFVKTRHHVMLVTLEGRVVCFHLL